MNLLKSVKFMPLIIVGLVVVMIITACNASKKEEQSPISKDKRVVLVQESDPLYSTIKTTTIALSNVEKEFVLPGVVKIIPSLYAELATPFSGRISKSFVKLGDRVTAGTPIFSMDSQDFFEAQKEFFDSRQEFKQAELAYQRQLDLFKNEVGTQKDLEEAELAFSVAKSSLENSEASLRLFKVDPKRIALGDPLMVHSPINGLVIANSVVLGKFIKDDEDALITIADLSQVYVSGQVKEKDFRKINGWKKVKVTSEYIEEKIVPATIVHFDQTINEETRSLEAIVKCDNANRSLKPGMYVDVCFIEDPADVILISPNAIFIENENQYVFKEIKKGEYRKCDVVTDGNVNGSVLVTSGLDVGDRIVVEGGIMLSTK